MDWDACARELGRALSRYNGLTNSAKLDLIADITGDELFNQKPFAFAHKVREYFEAQRVEKRSAEVHMHHGIAFGLLYRALPGASFRSVSLSSKLESTSHIALTPLGRTCRAAVMSKNEDFRKFILTYALLTADFDMYALLIKMADENGARAPDKELFYSKYYHLLEKRRDWMVKYFPSIIQRRQIQRHIRWIGRRLGHGKTGKKREFALDKIFQFDGQTPAHHLNQRKKWARESLGHLDVSGNLTEAGRDLAEQLPSVSSSPFFWLGPSAGYAKARIISVAKIPVDQCAPAWRLLRPSQKLADESQKEAMMDKTADFMESEFGNIQLGRFRQSSLDVVAPYLYFLERQSGGKVDEHDLFRTLLQKHKDKFACAQQPHLSQSHFRLR
ncbi:MAG: hypothetical protein ACR2QC_01830 [Gammaproteobacteria bacterium]